VVPKVGPLRAIDFKEPTAKTEDLYFKSVDHTVGQYGKALHEAGSGDLQTPEIDLDTGKPTKRGEYPLADYTYRELLDDLSANDFTTTTPELRTSILGFYEGFGFPPQGMRIDNCVAERWRRTWTELAQLRAMESLEDSPQL
jgi:hypothetical protein